MVEGLCGLVREAIKKNLFEDVMVGGGEVTISILQFEDDTLFFGKLVLTNMFTLKSILRGFELEIVLKVNFLGWRDW